MTNELALIERIRSRLRVREIAEHRQIFEGYSINHPKPGDVFVHICQPDGSRRSIRIAGDE